MNDALVQLMPLLVIGLVIGILMAVAASKVGRNPVLWFIFGVIPIVNFFFVGIATWSVLIEIHSKLKATERPAPN